MTDTHTTAHMPDEVVPQAAKLAAVKAYTEIDGKCRPVAMSAALEAALPYLSAPCAVEVDTADLIKALSRMAGNRHSDGTSTLVSAEDRSAIIDGCYGLMIAARAAKPVDVAAVREVPVNIDKLIAELKSAEDMCFSWSGSALLANELNATDTDEGHISLYKDLCGLGNSMAYLQSEIRALSPAEPAQGDQSGITISSLQAAHIERQNEWCPDQQPDLSFRGNEMAGEVGEACNVIKKLERERQGWRGTRSSKEELANELADVIHTAILCAVTAGIDLEAATVEKFNATSDKNDLRTRLPAAPTPEAGK